MQSFYGKRVLITGGLGFIGSNLAIRLADSGASVTVVDSLIPEYGGNQFNLTPVIGQVTINISDVRDSHSLEFLVRDQDYLFNLAGQTSHMDSMEDPFTDLEINCRAQLAILEVCRKVNPGLKVVFASTRQLYGRADYLPVDEQHILRPVDVNGINKMAGEWYHILYNNVYGIHSCSLRLTNTIGPRMRIKDARQTFIGVWIRRLLEGRSIEVWGGAQLRDFNYVDDVVDAMLLAASSDVANGRIYNLGTAEPVTLLDAAKLLIEVNGGGEFVVKEYPEERKRIDIGSYYSDFSLIRNELGWLPRTSLADCFSRTLAYYKEHVSHYV